MKKSFIFIYGCVFLLVGCGNQSKVNPTGASDQESNNKNTEVSPEVVEPGKEDTKGNTAPPTTKKTENPISSKDSKCNREADKAFNQKYPERQGKPIEEGEEELAQEWQQIRNSLEGCEKVTSNGESNIDAPLTTETQKDITNIMTSKQVNQLEKAGLPVILPTYIPTGFQLIERKISTSPDGNYGDYEVTFKGTNNSCFKIWATNGGVGNGATVIRQWTVKNKHFGEILLQEERFGAEGVAVLHANFYLTNIGNYFFDSPRSHDDFECASIAPQEAVKIIESLHYQKS